MKVVVSLAAAAVIAASGAPGVLGTSHGLKGANHCKLRYGGSQVDLRMVENGGTALAQYGLVRTACQVKVNGTLVTFGVEAADPSVPTIAATMMKTAPAIDAAKVHTTANPAMVYCAAYGGAEAGFVAVGLSFEQKLGQTDMCVFGDGSMASAWSLAYLGWAAEGDASDGFQAIRDKVSQAQVFRGVRVPGNIFEA
jgi:putative hemolysin